MPLPLKPEENIYIDHQIKEGSYSMPSMQAAPDHYTIGYTVSGDRRWISTERIRTIHAGDAGISRPHVYHRNCPISDVPYDRYVIKVRTENFQPIIDIIGEEELNAICANPLHFSKESQKVIQAMCEEILQEYSKNASYSQLLLEGMVFKLFFYMYENHIPGEYDEPALFFKKFDNRIHNALIFVENNLMYGVSIEEAAAYVSLSPSHFSRLFKNITGTSFSDYLTDVRLQHAQILLGNSQLSISEIAAEIGIANGNYLCTLFKKRYGITPTDYRNEIKKHN